MTHTMSNTDLVRRGYQAFNNADVETLQAIFADDAIICEESSSGTAYCERGVISTVIRVTQWSASCESKVASMR